jgi:hypothetical protein
MIARGWLVRDADGDEIGRVHEVTGDEEHDIFDGLTISRGVLSKDKYVPSEQVAEIVDGEVRLKLGRASVEQLEDFTEPAPQERILPESSRWYERLATWLRPR